MTAPLNPFTEYDAAVIGYVLTVAFLVSTMLIGGFLVINLGMMSRREEDRIGKRGPNDVGILKQVVWPEEKIPKRQLPAEEDDYVEPAGGHGPAGTGEKPKAA